MNVQEIAKSIRKGGVFFRKFTIKVPEKGVYFRKLTIKMPEFGVYFQRKFVFYSENLTNIFYFHKFDFFIISGHNFIFSLNIRLFHNWI